MTDKPTRRERRIARQIPNKKLVMNLGSNFYLFRDGEDFAKRLFIISHGSLDPHRPRFNFGADRKIFFDHALGVKGDLIKAQESARNDSWKYFETGNVHNYRLSKTQGFHAARQTPYGEITWGHLVQDYADIQTTQAAIPTVNETNRGEKAAGAPTYKEFRKATGRKKGEGEREYAQLLESFRGLRDDLQPYDVLTVRNRFWRDDVSLESAITAVDYVHRYTTIYGIFCRVFSGNAERRDDDDLLGRNPEHYGADPDLDYSVARDLWEMGEYRLDLL